jgi:hypothetical protein
LRMLTVRTATARIRAWIGRLLSTRSDARDPFTGSLQHPPHETHLDR